ncbi:hypothetical protein [Vibrio campbellii]|nr:hypothetical protein [Vibrio campbellii]
MYEFFDYMANVGATALGYLEGIPTFFYDFLSGLKFGGSKQN